MLFDALGLNQSEIPAGSLLQLSKHPANSNDALYCADPVTLIANRDDLMLYCVDNIQQDEAQALVDGFNALFIEDGLSLEAIDAHHWLLKSNRVLALSTTPTELVDGRSIAKHLPRGDDALWWRRLLAEVEMYFYTHPVNQDRQQKGLPVISSFWLWGGGELAPYSISDSGETLIVSNSPFAQGIAQWCGAAIHAIPKRLDDLDLKSKTVIFYESIYQAINRGSHSDLEAAINDLEHNVLKPALERLNRGELNELVLQIGHHQCNYTRLRGVRFWRRAPFKWNE